MSAAGLTILLVTAFLTSILSAIIGMGGGILLLAVMLSFMSHGQAIPLHAVVQLVSNSTRLVAYIRATDRRAFGRFVLGATPGAALGTLLLWWIGQLEASEPYLKCAVGAYVLTALFLPKPKNASAERLPGWDFTLLGFVAGAMALTVGAVGPLIAPIFARRDFVKERLIATKAACQMFSHVIKLPAFIMLGTVSLPDTGPLAVWMMLLVIPGTLIGKQIMPHISARTFIIMYRVALFISGVKVLIVDGLWTLMK